MEQLHIQEQQDPKNLEELNALLSKGDTETLEGLQVLGNTAATREVISHVAGNNPTFAGNLQSLQYNVGGSLTGKMRGQQCTASSEKLQASNNITDYFSLDTESTFKLQEELSELGLDIFQFLTSLKQHIETHLSDLKECHKEKIRLSIGRKTANISKIVSEIKSESTSPKDFKGKRWILNDKISEAYNFYTQELFPTLQMKLALNNGEKVPEKYTTRQPIIVPSMYGGVIEGNENFIEIDGYMNEIDQLLNANVDKNGDFDEGFFSTQSLLSRNNDIHSAMFEEMGIQKTEGVSLLNERDKQIQAEAMVYYLFAVGIQCVPYIGGVPGVAADATDIFSSQDATIMGLQKAGLIEKEFQMEKTTLDRILAGTGIVLTVVGLQALARSKKLAKALKKISHIPSSTVSEMLSNFGKKFNISADTLSGIRKLFGLEETKVGDEINSIDRSTFSEDIPRENLQLKEINNFQELTPRQFGRVNELLQEVIHNMKYNSFEKIDKLFTHYFKNANKTPGYTLQDAFKELDVSKVNFHEGSNCVGMSLELQRRLAEEGIDAKLIRFDAGGLINNDYVINGHSALVIPYIKDGKESFIFADPGLMIRQNLAFSIGENSDEVEIAGKTYRILAEGSDDLPYTLQMGDKKLLFDPHNEWVNPAETLNKDIMRAIGDFKIVRQNISGRPTVFRLDIQKGKIKLGAEGMKLDIPLDEFISLNKNSDTYQAFEVIMKDLGESPNEFYEKTVKIIERLEEYKTQIWSPSTREIINNQ